MVPVGAQPLPELERRVADGRQILLGDHQIPLRARSAAPSGFELIEPHDGLLLGSGRPELRPLLIE
ncbi:hypothetical protein AB0B78_32810 [Streptomyces sp. NPDC040724]|uniref:hypothetical protein n=1 Tax=Streptomyces sp. NPDC040724 TaxID=3155612 RepID=UPI0033F84CFA